MAYFYGYHTIGRSRRRRRGKDSWRGSGVGGIDLIVTALIFMAVMIVLILLQGYLNESLEPSPTDVFYVTSVTDEKIELAAINGDKTTTINITEFEETEDGGFFVMYNADTKKYSTVLMKDVVSCLQKRE